MELINTGRATDGDGDGLRTVADVQAFGERYAFHGSPAGPRDLPALRAHRARLDDIAMRCEAGDDAAAIELLNALLAQTGAIPQIVAHDGRGPHIHVSRPAAPLARTGSCGRGGRGDRGHRGDRGRPGNAPGRDPALGWIRSAA